MQIDSLEKEIKERKKVIAELKAKNKHLKGEELIQNKEKVTCAVQEKEKVEKELTNIKDIFRNSDNEEW